MFWFGRGRRILWLRQIHRLESRFERLEATTLSALCDALRWKTALNGANKGARRKSGQAKVLRARVEELVTNLNSTEVQLVETTETLRQTERTLYTVRSSSIVREKELKKQEVRFGLLQLKNEDLCRELEQAREVGVR